MYLESLTAIEPLKKNTSDPLYGQRRDALAM